VDVFWKFWGSPKAQGEQSGGWLYRSAVRAALDELRRTARRARFEKLFGWGQASPTPEQLHAAAEEQGQVRAILATMDSRQAELLLLRGNGLSYEETAAALDINPALIGPLIGRAQQPFRKEYVKRYGEPRNE
jgi:RNA polymerase sigma-70 factor, ECF subfamily